ncbi:MAG: Ni/Fe-hydrogenase cytochrome b subunit [Planctomycetes bacterium]|nr:Ni/Fe-hydrogenase cytochrome b subunit [Planctomycetota bacterium]
MTALERPRMSFWKAVFLAIVAVGLVLCYVRFTKGLGAVTNLSDKFPWGLWVGFDLLCGVGLAAGGFVITATVYIFHIERLRPVVRATILTAFLGYILVVSALMFDIGRPWAMWHPLVMWNPHSVMFEVSWCVTLYTTVLFLEFSGMIFEKLKWPRAMKVQHAITLPCVVAGVLLSTLHQSSLGTVYLIVPGKLHALWYTQTLPILFWISSVAAGLAMLIFESRLSSKAFGRQLEMPILSEAGRVLAAVLGVYGALRVYDLGTRGMFGQALDFSYESRMFLLEFVGGLLVPFVMLLFPKVRANAKWLYGAAVLTILGFVTNRLNVSITGFEGAQGGTYLPSVSETLITVFFVALGFGAFALGVRHLNIYPENEEKHGAGTKTAKPEVGSAIEATAAAPVVREMATAVRIPTA